MDAETVKQPHAEKPCKPPRVIYINEHKDGKLFNFYVTDERTAKAVCERGIRTRKFVEVME